MRVSTRILTKSQGDLRLPGFLLRLNNLAVATLIDPGERPALAGTGMIKGRGAVMHMYRRWLVADFQPPEEGRHRPGTFLSQLAGKPMPRQSRQ